MRHLSFGVDARLTRERVTQDLVQALRLVPCSAPKRSVDVGGHVTDRELSAARGDLPR